MLLSWHWDELLLVGKKEARGDSADLEQGAPLLEEQSKGSPSASHTSAFSELSDLSLASLSGAGNRHSSSPSGLLTSLVSKH